MKPALLVIDMQERFERTSRDMNIVENVVNVVQACHRRNIPVFFTQHHDPEESGVLYSWWKNPIIKGSDRWRLISDIAAAVDEERDTVITEKTRYVIIRQSGECIAWAIYTILASFPVLHLASSRRPSSE